MPSVGEGRPARGVAHWWRPAASRELSPAPRSPLADLWPLTLPMALTLGRLALVPVFLALVLTGHRWPALALFAGMATTDLLDGRLARRWGQTTRLGTLLDPAADKVLVSLSMLALAGVDWPRPSFAIPWAVPLGVFLKDLGVLIGVAVVIAKVGRVEISAARPGKWSTTVDLALVLATLLAPEWVRLSPVLAAGLLWTLWWVTVWAAAIAAVGYSREGARQIRAARASKV